MIIDKFRCCQRYNEKNGQQQTEKTQIQFMAAVKIASLYYKHMTMAAIHLHIKKEHLESAKEPVLHSIPCKIHGDEAANVSTYFDPYIRKIGDNQMQSSFRGYPLEGTTVTVPEGYKGITFFEYKKPEVSDAERNLYSTGIFTQFTYWNHDKIPSKNDSLVAALDWIDIAEALHSTVTDDKDS